MSELKFRHDLVQILQGVFRVHLIENKIVPGMPDLLVMRWNNDPVWLELKKDKNKLRRTQVEWLRKNPTEAVFVVTQAQGQIYLLRQKRLGDIKVLKEWETAWQDRWPDCKKKELWQEINEHY